MRRPGALHHARFMHHGLYTMKMALLAEETGYMTVEERSRVEQMAGYITLFHGPFYLQASLAAAAPGLATHGGLRADGARRAKATKDKNVES